MPGVYIHIPFCKQACTYCNFHFSTSLQQKTALIEALCLEMSLQSGFFATKNITSIYFGGGTPSILDKDDLQKLFDTLGFIFTWDKGIEITLEANPDDITEEKTKLWFSFGINRLSIGIQSFHESELAFMFRAHNRQQALKSIDIAQEHGFSNITCDLIYGVPESNLMSWEKNIDLLIDKNIPHISAYALTVEPKTVLHHNIKHKKIAPLNDQMAEEQFLFLMKKLSNAGFDHYEISNFGKPGHHAVHNTRYWLGDYYLGLGPSAHSYKDNKRLWNVANNAKYIQSIKEGVIPNETEILSQNEQYNEYVMTGLRTMWGIDEAQISNMGKSFIDYFMQNIQTYIDSGHVVKNKRIYTLSLHGKLWADSIASDLFLV
ncbi:MAG: radical SAM family heme chaperone HemW [Saprospiraceae bacterium]